MPIDLKKLKSIAKKAITATALREAGVLAVPVLPSGAIDEAAFNMYIEKNQPTGEWFGLYKLVTPEEYEALSRSHQETQIPDPFTRSPMTTEEEEAWGMLAPVQVLGGGTVTALDLCYYGVANGLMRPGVGSDLLLDTLPKGNEAVKAPRILGEASKHWPYDKDATDIVAAAKKGKVKQPTGGGTAGVNSGGSTNPPLPPSFYPGSSRKVPLGRLADLIAFCATVDDLRRWVRNMPAGDYLSSQLKEGAVNLSIFASDLTETLRRTGYIKDFMDVFVIERPVYRVQILALAKELGC